MKNTRREFIGRCGLAGAALALAGPALSQLSFTPGGEETREEILSDPDAEPEFLLFNKQLAFAEATPADLAKYPKKPEKTLALGLLAQALIYAGRNINRQDNEPQITEFLNIVDFDFRYPSGVPVPYCAAGISFSACQTFSEIAPAYAVDPAKRAQSLGKFMPLVDRYYFRPSASVAAIKENAEKRGNWIKADVHVEPKPGWLVIFSWSKNKAPNHIGIVKAHREKFLETVEFNTTKTVGGNQRNGGCVAERLREISHGVLGYVQLYS